MAREPILRPKKDKGGDNSAGTKTGKRTGRSQPRPEPPKPAEAEAMTPESSSFVESDLVNEDEDRDLRPQSMGEMIGQRDVYERLQIAVDAAIKRDEPLGHILLDGPPGLGKTLVAWEFPFS